MAHVSMQQEEDIIAIIQSRTPPKKGARPLDARHQMHGRSPRPEDITKTMAVLQSSCSSVSGQPPRHVGRVRGCPTFVNYTSRVRSAAQSTQCANPSMVLRMLNELQQMMEDVKPTIDICRAMQEKMDAEAKLKALVTNQAAKVKNFQDKPSKGYPSRKRSPSPQSSTSWRMMSSPQPTEALPPAPALPGSSTTRLGGSSVRGREEKAHRSCEQSQEDSGCRTILIQPKNEQGCFPTGDSKGWEASDATWSFDDGINYDYEPLGWTSFGWKRWLACGRLHVLLIVRSRKL